MRGHVRKRGEGWVYVADLGRDPEGKRKRKWSRGYARRKDAERALTKFLELVDSGIAIEPSRQPLGCYLTDEWLPAHARRIRPNTLAMYRTEVRRVERAELGRVPLRALTAAHLLAFYAELEHAGLAPGTRRLTHVTLKRALADAVRWGKVLRNPAEQVDPPRLEQPRVAVWTEGELRRFLEHARDDRLYALWRLAAATGMRRGELLAPQWRTLDLEGATYSVERQLVEVRGQGPTLAAPKRRRSLRTIALDPATVEALRTHRDTQLLERDLAGGAYVDDDFVFCDELGAPIRPRWLSDRFRELRTMARITTGTLHVLRHTHATVLLTGGIPVHVVASRLGDRAETVLSTYAHLLPQSDAEAAERMAVALSG
jgi:integrase